MSLIRFNQPDQLIQVRPLAVNRLRATVEAVEQEAIAEPVSSEADQLRSEIARLTALVDAHNGQLEAAAAKVQDAYDQGQADGFKSGLAAADERQSERLGLLSEASNKAQATLTQQWEAMERLAYDISIASLDKILGDRAQSGDLVTKIIRNQLSALAEQRVLRIEVSKLDFENDQALQAIQTADGVAVVASESLPTGGCRLGLSLGAVDVGLNQQWSGLRPLLAAWAEGQPS